MLQIIAEKASDECQSAEEMTLRHGCLEDLEVLAAIEAECFPSAEAASRESIRRRLERYADHFLVLMDGGTPAGYINGLVTDIPDLEDVMYEDAGMHNESGDWQMIFGVDTLPAYRRRGCAARMIEAFVAEAKSQGRKGVVLTCKERLLHYYAKFGFVNEGVSGSVHGGVVWYQMRLTF